MPAYGLLAFWLCSLGLERAAVVSSTTPMVLGQTFVLAAGSVVLSRRGASEVPARG